MILEGFHIGLIEVDQFWVIVHHKITIAMFEYVVFTTQYHSIFYYNFQSDNHRHSSICALAVI